MTSLRLFNDVTSRMNYVILVYDFNIPIICGFERSENQQKMAFGFAYGGYRRRYRRRASSGRKRANVSTVRAPAKRVVRRKQYAAKRTYTVRQDKPHPFIIANMNPFLPEAFNARVPDASTAPSSSITLREEAQLTGSNATNLLGLYSMPGNNAAYVSATQVNASTVSWGAAYGTNGVSWTRLSSLVANYNTVRPVAHGMRLTCPLPPNSAAGFVHVALYGMSTYNQATWELPTTVAGMRDLPSYKKMTLASLTQHPLIVVNKFLDQTAFRYTDTNSMEQAQTNSNEFHIPHSWMGILVMVDGHGTTSPCLDFEVIMHGEAQARFGTLAGDAAPEPQNEEIIQATAAAASESNSFFREGEIEAVEYAEKFKQCAARSFKNVMLDGAAQAGALLGDAAARGVSSAIMGLGRAYMSDAGLPGINDANRLTNG